MTFQSDILTHLLQSKRFNQLRLTSIAPTVYLLHLPTPTPSHHLSSIRLPKCIKKGVGMFH